MWTLDEIKKVIEDLCAKDNIKLSVPVEINSRLRSTLGRVKVVRYAATGICSPTAIQFSKKFIENATDEDIINVIKHEYVHYYLTVVTKEHHGHDAMFKAKCAEIGCEANKTVFTPSNEVKEEPAFKYIVMCRHCGNQVAGYHRQCKTLKEIEWGSNLLGCKNCNAMGGLYVIQNW